MIRITHNITSVINQLEAIRQSVKDGDARNRIDQAIEDTVATMTEGQAVMKVRIFNNGQDASETTMGKYVGKKTGVTSGKYAGKQYSIFGVNMIEDASGTRKKQEKRRNLKPYLGEDLTEYEKKRVAHGRQIGYKDLEFSGDLRRDIVTERQGSVTQIVIKNDLSVKKAVNMEKQIGNIRAGQNANTGSAEPAVIFALSKPETDFITETGSRKIEGIINELFGGQ